MASNSYVESACSVCDVAFIHRSDSRPGTCSTACQVQARFEKLRHERELAEEIETSIRSPGDARWLAVRVGKIGYVFGLVDEDRYQQASTKLWCLSAKGYAEVHAKGEPHLFLHQLLMGKRDDLVVDHANRKPLDNRVANLRWATRAQNTCNRTLPTNRAGFFGVWRDKSAWRSEIKFEGRRKKLGSFKSAVEAAQAYDAAARELHGPFARLNFV